MEKDPHIALDQFQQWMQQMLLNPFQQTDTDPDNALPAFGNPSVEAVVHHSGRLSAQEHLAIYQRSYIARLRHCMAQQFSALEFALGAPLFRAFADEYLAQHPSLHYNLAELGKRFPDHLEKSRPDTDDEVKEDWVDFMIELARFEYAVNTIFEQQGEEGYRLATADDGEDHLKLLPVFHLFRFRFPVSSFYTRFKKGEMPELPFENETHCVVLRHDYKLAVYDLHPEQHELLSYLEKGKSLVAAKSAFLRRHAADAAAFEQAWPVWKERWLEAKFFRV